ncbi:phosphoribosylglycinamide formyltransferase [Anaerococcus hydrogenalis]|uniref:Phosphoribosylglycinamide formyltransferase n=1 Tax=Anaerococcus hydrogenalis ACS-025-V-Sch4 TaxID=879306 RepID=F0H0A1_9FIRM|nr:phosphoribosylglycinamide formyltransferase [Anaerococcus hydrogenalis]EGC84103.1 phosphoribosylglycinamide formyltransferase [Anaerococcus hydrogenalis ACS-025-V-Sch4]
MMKNSTSNFKNIAILISGSGTNLQAIINSCEKKEINGQISIVISNKHDAYGLERAKKSSIKTMVCTDNNLLINTLKKENIDLVVLAGYLKILPQSIIDQYESKIINIHPSLIPSFCGMGFYGRRVHEKVFEKGVKFTGATTHFVTKDADAGPIIYQEIVKIDQDDTIDEIAKNVLEKEHEILTKSVRDFCDDLFYIKDNKVFVKNRSL